MVGPPKLKTLQLMCTSPKKKRFLIIITLKIRDLTEGMFSSGQSKKLHGPQLSLPMVRICPKIRPKIQRIFKIYKGKIFSTHFFYLQHLLSQNRKLEKRWKYFPFMNFENPLYFQSNFRWLWGWSKTPPNEMKLWEVFIYIFQNDIQPKNK